LHAQEAVISVSVMFI